jgi:hypothetical protein
MSTAASPSIPIGRQPSAKSVLEELLRTRRLHKDSPPLRGEDRRLRPLATGLTGVDQLLNGGFPRGQLSELQGPPSSGRTGVALALIARVTRGCGLVALVDPLDRLDPASASASGVDLTRVLWLRGPRDGSGQPSAKTLVDTSAAVATLAGSGLFELVVLDVADASRALRALPATTWLRLQRLVEETPTALLIVGDGHVACGPAGISLALEPHAPVWSHPPGPARLLQALAARARAGHHGQHTAELLLSAVA